MRAAVLAVLVACGGSGGGGGAAVTQAQADRACVAYASCVPSDGVNDCYTDTLPTLPPDTVRCLAAAPDCATARGCVAIDLMQVASCPPTAYSCSGDTEVYCAANQELTLTCGTPLATGPHCIVGTNGGAGCGVSTCSAASRACVGGRAQSCNTGDSVLEEIDCARAGLTCAGGVCTASGGGGACDPTAAARCEGAVAVSCDQGVEVRIDCATRIAGSTCYVAAGHTKAYCGFAADCFPTKYTETCTGTTLSYCADGVASAFDCTTLGLTCGIHSCGP